MLDGLRMFFPDTLRLQLCLTVSIMYYLALFSSCHGSDKASFSGFQG